MNRRGKPRKVALAATIHKLILILNAAIRDQVPWWEDSVSTATEA